MKYVEDGLQFSVSWIWPFFRQFLGFYSNSAALGFGLFVFPLFTFCFWFSAKLTSSFSDLISDVFLGCSYLVSGFSSAFITWIIASITCAAIVCHNLRSSNFYNKPWWLCWRFSVFIKLISVLKGGSWGRRISRATEVKIAELMKKVKYTPVIYTVLEPSSEIWKIFSH